MTRRPRSIDRTGDTTLSFRAHAPLERRSITNRPIPPERCGDDWPETFVAAPAMADWIRETFIAASGPLANELHEHLIDADLGVLWTNAINRSKQRTVAATAELPNAMAGGWKRSRHEFQLREWFGRQPDFLLTFSAPECSRLDDRAFCALVEHQLHHCAQALDHDDNPRFSREGAPLFAIRRHDVEEFTDVVRRYGPTTVAVRELVRAATSQPLIDGAPIALACGTCLAKAA